MFDLRVPSGLFFALTGFILLVVSLSSPRAPMTEANVDLYTGAAMVVFGGVLLLLASRSHRA